jgi:hypothetical protein
MAGGLTVVRMIGPPTNKRGRWRTSVRIYASAKGVTLVIFGIVVLEIKTPQVSKTSKDCFGVLGSHATRSQ